MNDKLVLRTKVTKEEGVERIDNARLPQQPLTKRPQGPLDFIDFKDFMDFID